MVGWHHRLDEHEFEQALGVIDGHGSLECCNSWGSQKIRHDLLTELPGKPGYELKADLIYFRMKVKEEDEKAGLKLNIQKTKILAFSTIPS